jgi:glucose-1-phosphate cytidylyltransferase
MKVVILAGGLGSRLSEETRAIPKPLVKIGNIPILIHIMNIYSSFGLNEFIICTGYKNYMINNFFHNRKFTMRIKKKKNVEKFYDKINNWHIDCVYTGEKTNTGGRILKLKNLLKNNDFCATYGDGLAKIDIKELVKSHKKNNMVCTLVAAKPPARFGVLGFTKNKVTKFKEKIDNEEVWINGGFFVFTNKIFKYIKSSASSLEKDVLEKLVKKKQINGYKLKKFWHPMDTLRDKIVLNKLYKNSKAPWIN